MSLRPVGPAFSGPRKFRTVKPSAPGAPYVSNQLGSPSALVASMVHLDMRLKLQGAYNAVDNKTFFVSPIPFFGDTYVYLVSGVSGALTKVVNATAPDRWFTAPGNVSSGYCILGTKAPFRVDLSEVVARDANERPEIDLGVLLKSTTLFHKKAGAFDVVVSHIRSDLWADETYSWDPDLTDTQDRTYARLRVRIGTVAEEATVSLVNESWEPISIAGLEVEYECLEGMR